MTVRINIHYGVPKKNSITFIAMYAIVVMACLLNPCVGYSQTQNVMGEGRDTTEILSTQQLQEVTVVQRKSSTTRMRGAENGMIINQEELFRAACCNLGESFVNNASVDVNYNDAATGARQIKLLGLSGTYVQMLTENIPAFRGAAMPYSLGYVPGPWMKSIQVSKGSSSVRNGFESITGQINVEYLKPDDVEGVTVNLYGDTESRFEANADANVHLTDKLSTELLAHYENRWGKHDKNGDSFQDMPSIEQWNVQNRWKYMGDRYIFHGGMSVIKEDRKSGQTQHHSSMTNMEEPYRIGISTNRYEGYMKHAIVTNREQNGSLALMTSVSMHQMDAEYGFRNYYVNEKNVYAQLLYETNIGKPHNLSVGGSVNYDYLGQLFNLVQEKGMPRNRLNEKESTIGAYAQYTYTLDTRLTAILGVRLDNSSEHGTFFTPRMHLKWQPLDIVAVRVSAGKGYRSVHALAENNYLLACGRDIVVAELDMEKAWNYGASAAFSIPLARKTLKLSAEYYYTCFDNQAVIDYDSDRHAVLISNLEGKSYSHVWQVDATYDILKGLSMTAAYRRNNVKTTYGGHLMEKPLTSKYKALLSASYKTPLGLWQIDANLQLNGGGRMPLPSVDSSGQKEWEDRFHGFEQVSAQVTRWFRHFSIYIGGENLTGFKQKHPVIGYDNPWGKNFDTTLVYGPVSGAMFYAGIRLNFGKL